MTLSREVFKRRVAEGVLAFPATPFSADFAVDGEAFRRHIADLVAFRPVAVVAAGGAGEVFSLSPEEHAGLTRAAVEAAGDIPVVVGIGFNVAVATEMARIAEAAGAASVLLFPPYLIQSEQKGLAAYVEAVCKTTGLNVIVYSRNNGILSVDTALGLADRCPNLVAVKDGAGDFENLVSLKQRAGDRLVLISGVPTAEIVAPQCFAIGIRSYTSAVFTFLPELALAYYNAVRDADRPVFNRILREFYVPLTAIRARKPGYAVSIVKAGLRIVGRSAGPLRPPLVDLTDTDEAELAALIAGGRAIVAELAQARPEPAAAGAKR